MDDKRSPPPWAPICPAATEEPNWSFPLRLIVTSVSVSLIPRTWVLPYIFSSQISCSWDHRRWWSLVSTGFHVRVLSSGPLFTSGVGPLRAYCEVWIRADEGWLIKPVDNGPGFVEHMVGLGPIIRPIRAWTLEEENQTKPLNQINRIDQTNLFANAATFFVRKKSQLSMTNQTVILDLVRSISKTNRANVVVGEDFLLTHNYGRQ